MSTVIDLAPEFLTSKYVLVSWDSENMKATAIKDDVELGQFLRDGSCEEGDILLEVCDTRVIRIRHIAEIVRETVVPENNEEVKQ